MIEIGIVLVNTSWLITNNTSPLVASKSLIAYLEKIYANLKNKNSKQHIIFNLNEYAIVNTMKGESEAISEADRIEIIKQFSAFTLNKECHLFLPILHEKELKTNDKIQTILSRRAEPSVMPHEHFIDLFTKGDGLSDMLQYKEDYGLPLYQTRNTVYLFANGAKLAKQDKLSPYMTDSVSQKSRYAGEMTLFKPAKEKATTFNLAIQNQTFTAGYEICLDHYRGKLIKEKKFYDFHFVGSNTIDTYDANIAGKAFIHADTNPCFSKVKIMPDLQPSLGTDVNITTYEAIYNMALEENKLVQGCVF